jgi:thioesterase domain-containing protein/acyl carrier protein
MMLRAYLKERLPEYMIPSLFIELSSLPVTPNGKVDAKALPAPDWQRPIDTPFVAPRNEQESAIQKLWQEVLQLPQIGINDDFFALGGTSIQVLDMLAKVNERFNKKIAAALVLQAPTIEKFVELVYGSKSDKIIIIPIQPAGSKPPIFCFPGVGGDSIVFRNLAFYLGNDQPLYGMQYPWKADWQISTYLLEDLAREYIKVIQTVQPHGPYYLVGFSFGGTVVLEAAQQLLAAGEEVATIFLFDCYGPGFPKLRSGKERALLHIKKLRSAEFKDKVEYFTKRFNGAMLAYKVKFWCKVHQQFPHSMRVKEILKTQEPFVQTNLFKRSYKLKKYDGPVFLFRAQDMEDETQFIDDPFMGWSNFLKNIKIVDTPGNHESIVRGHVNTLANQLKNILAEIH